MANKPILFPAGPFYHTHKHSSIFDISDRFDCTKCHNWCTRPYILETDKIIETCLSLFFLSTFCTLNGICWCWIEKEWTKKKSCSSNGNNETFLCVLILFSLSFQFTYSNLSMPFNSYSLGVLNSRALILYTHLSNKQKTSHEKPKWTLCFFLHKSMISIVYIYAPIFHVV